MATKSSCLSKSNCGWCPTNGKCVQSSGTDTFYLTPCLGTVETLTPSFDALPNFGPTLNPLPPSGSCLCFEAAPFICPPKETQSPSLSCFSGVGILNCAPPPPLPAASFPTLAVALGCSFGGAAIVGGIVITVFALRKKKEKKGSTPSGSTSIQAAPEDGSVVTEYERL